MSDMPLTPVVTEYQEVLVGQLDYREFIYTYLFLGNQPMTPYTIALYAGNYKEYIIRVRDKDQNDIDLTGASALMTFKTTKDGSVVLQKAGTISMPTLGEVRFYLQNADTVNLESRQYVFDVRVTVPSGNHYTVLEGVFDLKQPVNP